MSFYLTNAVNKIAPDQWVSKSLEQVFHSQKRTILRININGGVSFYYARLDDQILTYSSLNFKTDSLWFQNYTWYLLNLSHIFQDFLSSGGKIAFDSLKLIMELYSITENTKDEEGKINNLGWMKHTNNSRPVSSF